ncbi:MAG: alanine--tRNA ligase [Prosthecobacter sp.]|uniref:alanine--tRNA ligase n=1 Tax=Prosthecobacter sp. TaxID=1965333 RepID=UPI002624CF75|nr:alanine--tRNA ligase [Prosthecobacter sp.]MCF7788999.1 alanine--tRNA ligase [Prosthecobacter sp.]
MSAVPTAAQIRQSFLDFFKEKQHTIVPSDNVGYTSRDGARIFTNAGMNQFVPIFLGERSADVDTWPGVLHKGLPTRAADTQKCIRAGGKHNDLEDVGLDTYHHTLFEMLGNWSFGDYFKKEAISWAWELIIERWKFPPTRVFATIYQPGKDDPADRDQEAWDIWAEKFRSIGLDPDIHIVNGNKKDNFWMMGDTGPCGPCTEIHIDLTPGAPNLDEDRQRAGAKLVNGSDASCIEIWNNVFIQYNANPDGTFVPLPAQHVDTGMGFERVCSIIQGTKNFTDFETAKISNYDTDVFKPIFDELTKLSGKTYASTLPKANEQGHVVPVTEQEKIDVAFRVIADHLRTLSFAIADGIQPGNSDRNYTLRRILRRAVKYGRTLEFKEPFFFKLVDVLAAQMGDVFPELRTKKEQIKSVLKLEEESFNRTLDNGMSLIEGYIRDANEALAEHHRNTPPDAGSFGLTPLLIKVRDKWEPAITFSARGIEIAAALAFQLYDTFGFPLDLTELLARERGLTVDTVGFEVLMKEQRDRSVEAGKKNKKVISVSEIETKAPTKFIGYDNLEADVRVLEVVEMKDKTAVVLDVSTCYAEMGGQIGDAGQLILGANTYPISATTKVGNTWLHFLEGDEAPAVDATVKLIVDAPRRHAIERHHTVTHILHWALHEVVNKDATQKGSSVTPDKLTFDFNSAALTAQQISDIERLVNERIVANDPVSWTEVPYVEAKANNGIMALFGEKYGDLVRVVQIGGQRNKLDGWSMELCGGTHTRSTGEIGLFRLVSESAVASGVRRIEAIAGLEAYNAARSDAELLKLLAGKVSAQGAADLEKKLQSILDQQKALEKALEASLQREAMAKAKEIVSNNSNYVIKCNDVPVLTYAIGEQPINYHLALADALKSQFNGVAVLASTQSGSVSLSANVSGQYIPQFQAGKIIQTIAPIVDGKGGGKPDFARGGGKDVAKVDAALAEARKVIGA